MTLDPDLVGLAVVVLVAWTVQAITGFGSTVLALTLGAVFLPIPELLPLVIVLNTPLAAWTSIRHRAEIDRPALLRLILPWMGAGTVAGALAAPWIAGDLLKRGFGVMVLSFAIRDLLTLLRDHPAGPRPPEATLRAWVVLAGFIHGIYGSGGPALVQATSRLGLTKGAFRATMSAVWLLFNFVLIGVFVARGRFDGATLHRALWLVPVVPIGVWLGERLHPHLHDRAFRGLVQGLLVIGGAALLFG